MSNHQLTEKIKLVECPRDAMQGWKDFIPTEKKIDYLNALLKVGFDTVDCGSFVSPKAIPQMADTKDVLPNLNISGSRSKLLVIVANTRGAAEAVTFDEVTYIGFPFSISPTFQKRNTNSTLEESLIRVKEIQALCAQHNKQLVIYLSMGFGNPYGDEYNEDILMHWADEMVNIGVKIISLADTVGLATPEQVSFALKTLIPKYPETEFGVHLHSSPKNQDAKIIAALEAGCKSFDGAIRGIGGCPMAEDELVGNMNMERMVQLLKERNYTLDLNEDALSKCMQMADQIFVKH